MEATSLRFVTVARALAAAARAEGLTPPAFRSPPRLVGVSRSICRRRDGGATVAVVLRSRPWAAVVADMVEGVVAANRLRGVAADRARTALWGSVGGEGDADAGGLGTTSSTTGSATRSVTSPASGSTTGQGAGRADRGHAGQDRRRRAAPPPRASADRELPRKVGGVAA